MGSIPQDNFAMGSPKSPLQAPTHGNLITVLSIDGGGIRGIIPGTILAFLESQLQVARKLFWIYSLIIFEIQVKTKKIKKRVTPHYICINISK